VPHSDNDCVTLPHPPFRPIALALGAIAIAGVVAGTSLTVATLRRGPPAAAAHARTVGGRQTDESERVGTIAGPRHGTTLAHPADRAPTPVPVPHLGIDLGPTIRTCTGSRTHGTPTTSALCASWAASGPVNIVIVSTIGDPAHLLLDGGSWSPAFGGWLVASGDVLTGAPGCAPGWRGSGQQVELRINPTNRRHFKFIPACSASGTTVVFGEAHTDNFAPRSCGGDHMTDLDAARDALVAAYRALSGVTVTVQYRQDHPAGATYPGGCGRRIPSDGRTAYIVISA